MEKVEAPALEQMKERTGEGTRWAAYQNAALDSANVGHFQFLAVGPGNTYQEPPKAYPADTSSGMGWRYLFYGWANLETGEIRKLESSGGTPQSTEQQDPPPPEG